MPADKDTSSQTLLRMTKIGIIAAAHGIRGEVKIRSFTDPADAIFSCHLSDATGKRRFNISKKGGTEKAFIAGIAGIHNRNEAELLKGTELFAPASELPEKNRLAGLEAKLSNGKTYGRIAQLYNFGAGDIVEIELADGKTEMLPLNEEFVEPKKGYVLIHPPEYVEGKK